MSEAVTLALHARVEAHLAHKPLQAVLAPLSVDFGRRPMNITLVMSSSITTTLIMGAGLAVGAAVADGELGSVMGSMLLTLFPTRGFVSEPSMAVGRRRGTLRPPPWVSGSEPRLPGLV